MSLRSNTKTISSRVFSRVNLLGNPSDIYGGFGLGFPIQNWSAEVFLDPDISTNKEINLLRAAREVFSKIQPIKNDFGLRYYSDIPRQVGLAGSSALVMAALKVLGEAHNFKWTWKSLAEATLLAEREHLGIIAGPMDRWIQAKEEFLWMNFSGKKTKIIPIKKLPSLRILIHSNSRQSSGAIHAPIMERWKNGDPFVKKVMDSYRSVVEKGLASLLSGDMPSFAECIDLNFELRSSIFSISDGDRAVIDFCRRNGSAAKFCGSGGAIIALMKSKQDWSEFEKKADQEEFFVVEPKFLIGRK